MSTKTPLVLRYVIWTMLIFAFSMVIWSFQLLRPYEFKTMSLAFLYRQAFTYRGLKANDAPFKTIPMYGPLSHEAYFRIVKEAVRELKLAGAKAVIVPLPNAYSVSPRSVNAILDIARDSIVIFGVAPIQNSLLARSDNFSIRDPRHRWVGHPLPGQPKISWGVMTATNTYQTPIIRFVPTGFRESNKGEPVSDVALLALKRYFNIPAGSVLQPSGSRLQVGSTSIHLSREGVTHVKFSFTERRGSDLWAMIDEVSDSIRFNPSWAGNSNDKSELQKAWERHRGKIVFLEWNQPDLILFPSYSWMYMQFFGSLFDRSFVSVHNEWNVLLITTVVMLLSVFSYTVRNGYTVLFALTLSVILILVSLWLLIKYNVLYDPIYVLVPIFLCGVIFPVVKTSGEKKIAEATIRSLEEENKRLLELQRRSQTNLPH